MPHSRLGRMLTFGGLAAGLGVGTIAEMTRRTLGVNNGKGAGSLLDASPFLTEANAKRIVDTLCKVRGRSLYILLLSDYHHHHHHHTPDCKP